MTTGSIALVAVVAIIAVVAVVVAVMLSLRGREESWLQAGAAPWYQVLLAVGLLVLLAIVFVQLAVPHFAAGQSGAGATAGAGWRTESRAIAFVTVMIAIAALGLIAYLAYLIAGLSRTPPREGGARDDAEPGGPGHENPVGLRVLGLLVPVIGLLLLAWLYLPPAQQYATMLQLVYPATFALAVVLLFDKATRAWSVKTAAESFREWLLCDSLVLLLALGFLNLLRAPEVAETYASFFWDTLHIAAFVFVFWLLDRKLTRHRFLVAYCYFALLPLLLLIWRTTQAVAAPEDLSWWGSIWPFFSLALIFLVLEIITLAATRDAEQRAVPAIKDTLFVVLYAVLLLIAIPETPAA